MRVISAHRALNTLTEYVREAEKESQVFIGIAGKAAHLSGVIAGLTTRPVIGIPVKASAFLGLDALLSTVEMPSGVPVATVAVGGGENAAILAAEILAVADEGIREKLIQMKKDMEEKIRNTSYTYEG